MTERTPTSQRAWIGLGGNQGDPAETFRAALNALDDDASRITRVSSLWRTVPIGSSNDPYLNAAAEVATHLSPPDLLARLQQIENDLGRVRETHWGPRRIDLDLLLHEQTVLETPVLTLPHPALWWRRFVLDPLAEIAPDLTHPVFGTTIRALHARLLARPLAVLISGGTESERDDLARSLASDNRITLPCGPTDGPLRIGPGGDDWLTVTLPSDPAAARDLARWVTTAALDEPVPVGSIPGY